MDVSPVQSGSKCGSSDFSIERLLSDDTKNREESDQVPDWLCCTRYRPPRLPRAPPVCRSRRAGRHARVPFTAAQATALEAAYSRAPYLAPPALRALAAGLQLRDDRIKIWFQNRRARERREKSVNITPPNAITLPPTTQVSSIAQNSWIPHTADTRINDEHRNDASTSIFTNRHIRISETIDALRHDVVLTRQRIEGNAARFLNAQSMPSLFPYKEDSDDDDDGSLDIETVED